MEAETECGVVYTVYFPRFMTDLRIPSPFPFNFFFSKRMLRVGFVRYLMANTAKLQAILQLERVREQCTVVFALNVTEPAGECVCLCVCVCVKPLATSRLRNNLGRDDIALLSRFLHKF